MVESAGMAGHLNNIILEIVNYGQEVRNKVDRILRNDRLKEEQIMKVMLAEIARDERLDEKAKKRAAWLDKYYKMEAAEMTTTMGMLIWLAKWAWAKLNKTVHSTVYMIDQLFLLHCTRTADWGQHGLSIVNKSQKMLEDDGNGLAT